MDMASRRDWRSLRVQKKKKKKNASYDASFMLLLLFLPFLLKTNKKTNKYTYNFFQFIMSSNWIVELSIENNNTTHKMHSLWYKYLENCGKLSAGVSAHLPSPPLHKTIYHKIFIDGFFYKASYAPSFALSFLQISFFFFFTSERLERQSHEFHSHFLT